MATITGTEKTIRFESPGDRDRFVSALKECGYTSWQCGLGHVPTGKCRPGEYYESLDQRRLYWCEPGTGGS